MVVLGWVTRIRPSIACNVPAHRGSEKAVLGILVKAPVERNGYWSNEAYPIGMIPKTSEVTRWWPRQALPPEQPSTPSDFRQESAR